MFSLMIKLFVTSCIYKNIVKVKVIVLTNQYPHKNIALILSTITFPLKSIKLYPLMINQYSFYTKICIFVKVQGRKFNNQYSILYPELSFPLRSTLSLSTLILQYFCKI
jgi:hypothetical protein